MQQKEWGEVSPQDRTAFLTKLVPVLTGVLRYLTLWACSYINRSAQVFRPFGRPAGFLYNVERKALLRSWAFNLILKLHLPESSGLEFRAFSQVKLNALCFPICYSTLTSVSSVPLKITRRGSYLGQGKIWAFLGMLGFISFKNTSISILHK